MDRLRAVRALLAVDEERGDALVALARIDGREHERELRHRAVGDPHLPAVDDPAVAVALRRCLQSRRVAADRRLSEAEARDDLALTKAGEPRALLLFRAPFEDRQLHQRDLHGERRPHRRVRAADLLGDQAVADVVDAHPAVLLGHGSTEESDRRHLFQDVRGELLRAVSLARARRDLAVREVSCELADRFLFGSELEVHRSERSKRRAADGRGRVNRAVGQAASRRSPLSTSRSGRF